MAVVDHELGHVDRAVADARIGRGHLGGHRGREIAQARVVRLHAMIDVADVDRIVGELARPIAAGDDHRRRAIGDGRQIVQAQRRGVVRPGQQFFDRARCP